MKKSILRVTSIAILFCLLFHSSLALEGAKKGLILWSSVVLPTLLPFMICSSTIVALGAVPILITPIKYLLHPIISLSNESWYILISGLLCGYPMGAKNCNDFFGENRIQEKEAKYLLSISNHPSIMFLIGYTFLLMPPNTSLSIFILSLYLPIIPIGFLAKSYYKIPKYKECVEEDSLMNPPLAFDQILLSSIEVMVKIGGYMMIFSILAQFILSIPIENLVLKAFFLGFVEITTGIPFIAANVPTFLSGIMIIACASFGGLSGIFQTKSVLKNAGLSIRHYFIWKGLYAMCSVLTFLLMQQLLH